jgi:two-component sensor histidine kinase
LRQYGGHHAVAQGDDRVGRDQNPDLPRKLGLGLFRRTVTLGDGTHEMTVVRRHQALYLTCYYEVGGQPLSAVYP